MRRNHIYDRNAGFSTPKVLVRGSSGMNHECLQITERIEEIMMMCAREDPIYEQVSSFGIVLYALGFFDCPDLMSFQDVDTSEAGVILDEHFTEIKQEALPLDYHITESKDRYLMVVGDPLFPIHFAVLVDNRSSRPFLSKLPFFGCGFDSLEELANEFVGIDDVTQKDIHFFKRNRYGEIPQASMGKIYIAGH